MIRFSLLVILAGCASSTQWKLDSIATGVEAFDSMRLLYEDSTSPLRFEIVRLETGIEAFLSLTRYKFSGLENILVQFEIEGVRGEVTLPLLSGKMRIRLPEELTKRFIKALQEGREVVMIVDGSEQHLDPEQFAKKYEKLEGAPPMFQTLFKGIFDL
jgi:hypothetical protein